MATPPRSFGKNKSGLILNSTSRNMIFHCCTYWRNREPERSVEDTSKFVADMFSVGKRTVFRRPRSVQKRRRSAKFDSFTLCALRSCVHDFFRRNEIPTVEMITAKFSERMEPPSLRRCTVHRLLAEIGFKHEKRSRTSLLIDRDDITDWRNRYLRDMEHEVMVSSDVVSLFTSIPTDLAVESCAAALEADPHLAESLQLRVRQALVHWPQRFNNFVGQVIRVWRLWLPLCLCCTVPAPAAGTGRTELVMRALEKEARHRAREQEALRVAQEAEAFRKAREDESRRKALDEEAREQEALRVARETEALRKALRVGQHLVVVTMVTTTLGHAWQLAVWHSEVQEARKQMGVNSARMMVCRMDTLSRCGGRCFAALNGVGRLVDYVTICLRTVDKGGLRHPRSSKDDPNAWRGKQVLTAEPHSSVFIIHTRPRFPAEPG
ncbi:hypothetical protein HPB52_023560 [Rhipicephalus sanguineus]|uniref:Uncharacterized protein n=1 Tax=Rhipicephalus sanguineus TaxID=34632 RepID=A0A9D4SQD3_RHISA|nr:hypothetical protein HPB52_023560 [Rhipicephalus sanguineus]